MDAITGITHAHLQEVGRQTTESANKGKESKGNDSAPSASMTLNESAWGEDSSNRNQYFGSDSGNSKQPKDEHVEPEASDEQVFIPRPEVVFAQRHLKTFEFLVQAAKFMAKKLVPFT